ncbi:TlpA disulfide reductase family protein [Variovorax dokdonensis]|uniref:TlpA disulfide reductase family protein n=1 Tax=Variovorax dokdonensis TaxID=344883 RepID=A0ABT7NBI4_9BURK|nr:TlpA disulfide reductase family protein [Variovorax dokdonensis]MDM0045277.1 TlpA disulfide reductase family protein [Variovorax dokdonensis]
MTDPASSASATSASAASRRNFLFVAAAAAAATAGAGAAWWQARGGSGDAVGADFWARTFERPDGGEVRMEAFRGKPMLLNFWATWCAPCVEEMPMIDAFFKQNAANGLQVLGLAIDQPSAVRKFLQRTPVGYEIGLAGMGGTEMVRQLGNAQGGLPFTVSISAGGEVLARKMGKLEPPDLEGWRRELFHG